MSQYYHDMKTLIKSVYQGLETFIKPDLSLCVFFFFLLKPKWHNYAPETVIQTEAPTNQPLTNPLCDFVQCICMWAVCLLKCLVCWYMYKPMCKSKHLKLDL